MENDLLLLSGNDIPFIGAQATVHQPTIKEIAYLGEENFYTGCEFLRFSKDNLDDEDKIHLEHYTNFDVLMSIMKEQNITIQRNKTCVLMLLTLLFPNYNEFLDILNSMFCLKVSSDNEYNPSGDIAKRIADKLKKRHQKLAEKNSEPVKKVAILSRYVSILSVGEQKDMNSFMQYTVYQLFDEFKRYELKMSYDFYFQAKLAGAKDLQEVDD